MQSKNILFISLIYISISAFSCKSKPEAAATEGHSEHNENIVELTNEQLKKADVQFGKIELRTLSNILKVNGTICVTPQSYATVCTPLGGFVKNTDLIQGSQVVKGQTLALIENIEFIELQQDYLEAKAKFNYAESDYNRQKDLFSGKASSEKTFQLAETEYKSLKAKMNSLMQKLLILGVDVSKLNEDNIKRVFEVVSPISGYVKTVKVNIGKYINNTDVLFEIVNTQNITLEFIVFEKDIDKLQIGQKISFFSPNNLNNKFKASIYQIGKALDNDRTITVYASVDKPSNLLMAGGYINGEIEVANNLTTSVPVESIVQFDEKNYIFAFKEQITENGKEVSLFEVVEITKGIESNGFIEISLPKNFDYSNRQIVVKGAYTILSAFKNSGEMSC